MKTLVAYFSPGGSTKDKALKIAKEANADIFEIKPKVPYTKADLNWMDSKSRTTIEMNDSSSRPEIVDTVSNISDYDTIFLGFPIWWYTAPTIIKTFLESLDLSNKKIALFATSGSSGLGSTAADLKPSVSETTKFVSEKLLNRASDADIKDWVSQVLG